MIQSHALHILKVWCLKINNNITNLYIICLIKSPYYYNSFVIILVYVCFKINCMGKSKRISLVACLSKIKFMKISKVSVNEGPYKVVFIG